ncbi:MAG TPA: DUF5915 domain-containing protein, partial [Candidatus Hydrogenedentes bacterium]|nr:DUF5915 domain-containing protein [Candidatus Hydrogenedentota bacterium]
DKTGYMEAVGSYAELMAKPGAEGVEVWERAKADNPNLVEHLKIHKPYIDAITYASPKDPSARMRRVPEVIDVWFDAGCMPFAQWGYPHLPGSEEQFARRFPADFISEAIDQTRGWFNALLVISTIVHGKDKAPYPHPFKSCICLGHIMGEDGLKLSKRLKNYQEPGLLFDQYSADALRWSFFAKNPPTSTGRLSERNVEEVQRELLIRWYNVYSFFVIYANLDGFNPSTAPAAFLERMDLDPAGATGDGGDAPYAPREDRAELDRWILHELDRTTLDVREAMEDYGCNPAARSIQAFVESLSNWYVRRSREQFWASGWSPEKANAYWTLYECLLKLAQLAAPFVPFFAEITWRNLSKPLPGAPESVHLCAYPSASRDGIDIQLLDEMAAAREAVTLGLSARRTANIKVRQPLSRCELVLSSDDLRRGLEKHIEMVKSELNVKEIAFTDDPDAYVSFELKPNFKLLGPRLGKKVKSLGKALAQGDTAAMCAQLQNGALTVDLDGETVELTADEVEVRLSPKEGFAAAQGRHMVAVISTEITEELRQEGWVREFIRCVQDIRKDQRLAYDARISLAVTLDDGLLATVLTAYKDKIAGEVLAEAFTIGHGASNEGKQVEIDGVAASVLVNAL